MSETSAETVYERIARLEDEIAAVRSELDRVKNAMRNKIARHEISLIKHGSEVRSIID